MIQTWSHWAGSPLIKLTQNWYIPPYKEIESRDKYVSYELDNTWMAQGWDFESEGSIGQQKEVSDKFGCSNK